MGSNFVQLGILIYYGTGMWELIPQLIEKSGLHHHLASTIVPFNEAARFFNPAPLQYVAATVLATIVNALESLNLLL